MSGSNDVGFPCNVEAVNELQVGERQKKCRGLSSVVLCRCGIGTGEIGPGGGGLKREKSRMMHGCLRVRNGKEETCGGGAPR